MEYGLISMRNEDGTQWLEYVWSSGSQWTFDQSEASTFPESTYEEMLGRVKPSRQNDSPDNGFFGLYNLKFHPVAHPRAHQSPLTRAAICDARFALEDTEGEGWEALGSADYFGIVFW